MEPLGLPGRHNRRNALIARRCLVALGVPGAGDDARLRAAAAGYRPLPSRLTPVGTVGGVTFVEPHPVVRKVHESELAECGRGAVPPSSTGETTHQV